MDFSMCGFIKDLINASFVMLKLRAVGAGLTGALQSDQKKMLTHDACEISAYQSRACISSALKKLL